ncbi:hypothetical protein JOC48_004207 [Aquibacillus albus]|uniref:Uncharacterized protein n=1 Tax=Aquibacillus albus TaxID=1168171 RepID=A0ABS2N683_9BACI|nr:hypothetical protein [Aquibacillus albus]
MGRTPTHNNEVYIRLKNKPTEELTKDDMRDALNLAKSTGRMEHKVFYTSVKHHARQNEDRAKEQADNDNEEK